MGTADVECVAGCTCAPGRLDGTTQHRYSVLMPFIFQVRPLFLPSFHVISCVPARLPLPSAAGVPARLCLPAECRRVPQAPCSSPPNTSQQLTLPPHAPPQASQSERCRVRVTISERPGAHASGEHKVVLAAVVVATEGTAMHPWA